MTKGSLAVALIAAAFVPAGAGASVKDTCAPAGQPVETVCYGGDAVVRDGQAYADPGRFDAALAAYDTSWTHRALAFQYKLANDVGMIDAPWLGTHNSFNSIAQQGPALSTTDANQQLTLVDQLRLDMRSLELDVHWFPSVRAGGQNAPVVCHAGAVSDHDGCSTEPLLAPVLDQIAGWLRAHRDQVLLLYVEDHLDSGYDSAAATIKQSLGSMVYATGSQGGACVELPHSLTREAVRRAGAQVVIVSNCGSGAAWRAQAFSWKDHVEETPHAFKPFPDCGPNYTRAVYDAKLVRYYEDSTWLSSGAAQVEGSEGDGITPATARALSRCGVDLLGFDQLVPGDGRLDALAWSWAEGQPGSGTCASIGADGRWSSGGCRAKRPAVCRTADGAWLVTARLVKAGDAGRECGKSQAAFAVPHTGYDNESLKLVTAGTRAWIGLSRTRDGWRPQD